MKNNQTIPTLVSVTLAALLMLCGPTQTYAQNKIGGFIKSKITKTSETQKAEPAKETKSWFDEPAEETKKAETSVVEKTEAAAARTEAEAKDAAAKVEAEAKAAAMKTAKEAKVKEAKPKAAKEAEDNTVRILMIGNSFTFYNDSWDMLAKICSSENKEVEIVHATMPGYTFGDHLKCDETTQAILLGDYDFAILQDQSQTPAKYALDPKGNFMSRNNFITMTNRIFGWSPYAKIIVEETWAYVGDKFGGFTSMTEFDNYLQNGARLYAEVIRGKVSPTGTAFATVRNERPDIKLYTEDEKHPSAYGSYLKSLVDYLTIFGGKFTGFTDSCGLDPEICKYLKTVAKKTVDSRAQQ